MSKTWLRPTPGLLVVARNGVERRVTHVAPDAISYVEQVKLGNGSHERRRECKRATWEAWCKKNGAEESLPV